MFVRSVRDFLILKTLVKSPRPMVGRAGMLKNGAFINLPFDGDN
jgi:hypothetical protein